MKRLLMVTLLVPQIVFAKTRYVDATFGDDSSLGTSWTSARKTIQSAIDDSADNDTIYVAPGAYSAIATKKTIRIVAVGGADRTKIIGGDKPCAEFWYNKTNTVLIGFTCANGASGVIGGSAYRCILKDNNGQGSSHGYIENCLVLNNTGINGGGCQGSVCINCTIVGNRSQYSSGDWSAAYDSSLYNCIVYGNAGQQDVSWDMSMAGCKTYNVYTHDPKFEDDAIGDYRLKSTSPCVDAGIVTYTTMWRDLDGHSRIAGKTIDVGCFENVYVPSAGRISGIQKLSTYSNAIAQVYVDGAIVMSSQRTISFDWEPMTVGRHTIKYAGGDEWSEDNVFIYDLAFDADPAPNPPMSKDNKISITPTTSEFEVGGGYYAITTSGASETWTAAASDDWIVLKSTTGEVGKGCAYTVTASTNVETRTGYVYVSGHVHTVKQAGWGATISHNNVEFECDGGTGTVDIAVSGKYRWNARPNVDWLSVTPTRGVGSGQVTYQVAPWHEVSTRSGTLTIAGNTFTVFQYGKRMKLSSYRETRNYETHVIPITVDALAITKWGVTPNASWISIADAGSGQGGDDVGIVIAENPSYKARTGTVTIGTETLTIVQEGRTALMFAIDPETTTADVGGANGLIAVVATPDLPWTSASKSNWLTVYPKFKTGEGNGNVVYTASPNPTLYDRTGTITITPEAASGVAAKTHTVTQPAAVSSISLTGYEFEAAGENCAVEVMVDDIVEWQVDGATNGWLTVVGDPTRVGPATITLQAAENTTVYPRNCTLTIARKTFVVTQKGRGVSIDTDSFVFGTQSSGSSFMVSPDGNVSWMPVSSDDSWLILFDDSTRTGNGEVQFVVTMYNGTGVSRTGTITVGDKVVYVTQRAFDLSINPTGAWVYGNAGAGEVGVSAPIGAVWEAIVTEPWIKVISGYNSGTGDGTVRYTYEDNNTGKTRSGKIVISGTAYTIEQAARIMVSVKTEAGNGGAVSGGGSYSLGSEAVLTAHPADGYKFAYWEGDVSSMQNPITVTVDVTKNVKAVFTPLTPEFISVSNAIDGVMLVWTNLAWATEYNIYRAPSSSRTGGPLVTQVADGTHSYFDTTGEIGVPYWYWVEAVGAVDTNECVNPVSGRKLKSIVFSNIAYLNLRETVNVNPSRYQEGVSVVFVPPASSAVGYTFAGWEPSGITAATTGDVVVTANWTANSYEVAFHANGGSGVMDNLAMTYDVETALSSNSFVRSGYVFRGWAEEADGDVVYTDGAIVSNLTARSDGVVEMYAVWSPIEYRIVFHANGGCGTMEDMLMKYDTQNNLTINVFVRKGCIYQGWATEPEGDVVYENGDVVLNISQQQGDIIDLYAIWYLIPDGGPYTEIVDGIEWTFKVVNGETVIEGTEGDFGEYSACIPTLTVGEVAIPTKLGGSSVTRIGESAFYGCSGLTSVIIPSSVTSIGFNAFGGCSGLTSITIPSSVTSIGTQAFAWCSGLTSVTIPSSVTSIGVCAFFDCSGLTSVTIPSSVMSIGDCAFAYCSGLTSVTIPSSVTSIGDRAFAYCSGLTSVTIPSSVTSIGDCAFDSCSLCVVYVCPGDEERVKNLLIASDEYSMEPINISKVAFVWMQGDYGAINYVGLRGLEHCNPTHYAVGSTIVFVEPEGNIPGYTFTGWTPSGIAADMTGNIVVTANWQANNYTVSYSSNGGTGVMEDVPVTYDESFQIASNEFVRTGYIFAGWSIDANDTVEYAVGDVVSNLTAAANGNVKLYAVWSLSGGNAGNPYTEKVDGIMWNYVVRDGFAIIGSGWYSFQGLPILSIDLDKSEAISDESPAEIIIPDKLGDWPVDGISFRAFWMDCIKSVVIQSGMTRIGEEAFKNCRGLETITIPSSVTNIGKDAFCNCCGLKSIIFEGLPPDGLENSGLSRDVMIRYDHVYENEWDEFIESYNFMYGKILDGGPYTETVRGVEWTFTVEGGNACIDSVSRDKSGDISIPSMLGWCEVTSIGDGAFRGCSSLESIEIPSSVTSIGDDAFCCCSNLRSVNIKLGVTSIGGWAFEFCSSLESIEIPSSVTSIGKNAFDECPLLSKIIVDAGDVERVSGLLANSRFDVSNVTFVQNGVQYGLIDYVGVRGLSHDNPTNYIVGSEFEFVSPSGSIAGYTFAGWTPSRITAATTGDVVVAANWTANGYTIAYSANGGSGEVTETAAVYDQPVTIATNGFTYADHEFKGWAITANGSVIYEAGAITSNLTSAANGIFQLYAVWEEISSEEHEDPPEVYEPPADWIPVTQEDTLVLYAVVSNKQTKAKLETEGSLLAAFAKNGECRGVATIGDGPKGTKLFQLSIGVKSASEKCFSLKVWNAATGEIIELTDTVDCNAEKILGAMKTPIIFAFGATEVEITLKEGWNWISTGVVADDATVGAIFAGLTFADDDLVKSAGKTATYCDGEWFPASFTLQSGVAYMMRKSAGGTEKVIVSGSEATDGIAVKSGWNWIASPLLTTQTVAKIVHSAGFAEDDLIKGVGTSATYCDEEWFPSSFKLVPGVGYKAKLANAGTLAFGGTPLLTFASATPKLAIGKYLSASAKPNWEAVEQEDTLVVYLQVSNEVAKTRFEADGTMVAAFTSSGECRGVATIDDGPKGSKVFQLSIGVTSSSDGGFMLKVWDPISQTVYDIDGMIYCNEEKIIAKLTKPQIMMAIVTFDPIPDLGENPTEEEIAEVLIAAEDSKLVENVTNATEYAAFCEWADSVKTADGEAPAGAEAVMAAENAWLSFALGSDTLIETLPTEEDIKIEEFEPKNDENGKFEFTVSVKDVEIGSEASKENLKKVFGLEGTSSLKAEEFSSAKVDISFDTPENGKVKFTAGPKDGETKNFFMKVKMTP